MIRWGKPTKNKKRRDPRYFLDEAIDYSKLFDENTGKIDEDIVYDIFEAAANGDKAAQIFLALQAANIKKSLKLSFNSADGTPLDSASVMKKYGLDRNEVNYDTLNKMQQEPAQAGQPAPTPAAQQAQAPEDQEKREKNIKMIQLIKIQLSRESDPAEKAELEKAIQHFQSQI